METGKPQVHTINSSLLVSRSSENTKAEPQKETALTMLLMRLAVHYYRADFNQQQATSLIRDMVEDLGNYVVQEVDAAIRAYRLDAKERYFPRSGQLKAIIERHHAEGSMGCYGPKLKPEFGDSRPIRWWLLPRQFWQPHWRVGDIPEAEQGPYARWVAARKFASRETV